MKKRGLSVEEHHRVGEALKSARKDLVELGIVVSDAYLLGSKPCMAMAKIIIAIDEARYVLERELAEKPTEGLRSAAYFGDLSEEETAYREAERLQRSK